MSSASPSFRHPIILSLWAGVFVVTGLGLSSAAWFILVFMASPLVAIGTFAAVYTRAEVEPLRAGWSIAYRITSGLLALAAVAGLFAAAGGLVRGETRMTENGPLAALFLFAFLAAWPAIARPSPRRAAIPAMAVHISWLPLVIANALSRARGSSSVGAAWDGSYVVVGASIIAIVALSAIIAVLAVVGFTGESKLAPARVEPPR